MARTFLAIDLPSSHRQRLRLVWPQPADGLRPAREDQLHLTLHFLDEVDDTRLHTLHKAVAAVAFQPFPLTICGVGRFPLKGKPSVLWAGVETSEPLLQLHADLAEALEAADFPTEHRPYRPHITIARLTPRTPRSLTERFLADHASLTLSSFDVSSFAIYESRRFESRSEHLKLATVSCSG